MDFDPRDYDEAREDERWGYDRDRDDRERDRDDPRDPFVDSLDLPRGLERELVQDDRENLYALNGEDSRMLATIGAFQVVAERDLDDVRDAYADPRDATLDHLRDEGLIRFVQIDGDERAAVLTDRGCDVLDAHRRDREDDRDQEFHSGLGRARELQHDAQLFRAYLAVEKRLRDEGAEIERVVLERDLRREYQEFLQEHNRDRPDSDGRPDRDQAEIEDWAREHDLPYFDDRVHLPDFRIEYELDGRDRHEDVEVLTAHFGYDNVDIDGGNGRRSHVERRINDAEAAIGRRIFAESAKGHGVTAIAKILNAAGAPAPRAQQGRPTAWAPSSVREVLYRDLYRGVMTWNRSRKRNPWGQVQAKARPQAEWFSVPAPQLRIVSEDVWQAVHDRLDKAREHYLRGTRGELWGRPASGVESKYLLPGLARCATCHGNMYVKSRSHGRKRAYF